MSRGHILALGLAGVVGCSFDWGRLDPRDATGSEGATTASSGGAAGGNTTSSGAGGAATSTSSGSGGAGGQASDPNCLIPLTDDFGAPDTDLWDVDIDGDGCQLVYAQSAAVMSCEEDVASRHAELRSRSTYDFETCGVVVDLQAFTSDPSGGFGLELVGLSQRYAFEVEGDNITSIQTVSGNDKTSSTNFSPAAHRWWWIGGRDGCAAWDFSADGTEWEEYRRRCDMSPGELQVVLYVRAEAGAAAVEAAFGGVNAP